MSKKQNKSADDYDVGYGKPPKKHASRRASLETVGDDPKVPKTSVQKILMPGSGIPSQTKLIVLFQSMRKVALYPCQYSKLACVLWQ